MQSKEEFKCTGNKHHWCLCLHSQLLQSHGDADRMVLLLSIYQEEDQAYQDVVTVATAFFQYLLQPFRDMRELACLYKMEILVNTASFRITVADIFYYTM